MSAAVAHDKYGSLAPLPSQFPRPQLRLLPPLAPRRLSPEVYRRRRIVVGVVATVVVLVVASYANSGLGWAWNRVTTPPVAAASSASAEQVVLQEWTVRPGDTLWGIARAMQPQGDFRPVLDKLTTKYKNQPLQVGETISIK